MSPFDLDGAVVTADAAAHPGEHRRVDPQSRWPLPPDGQGQPTTPAPDAGELVNHLHVDQRRRPRPENRHQPRTRNGPFGLGRSEESGYPASSASSTPHAPPSPQPPDPQPDTPNTPSSHSPNQPPKPTSPTPGTGLSSLRRAMRTPLRSERRVPHSYDPTRSPCTVPQTDPNQATFSGRPRWPLALGPTAAAAEQRVRPGHWEAGSRDLLRRGSPRPGRPHHQVHAHRPAGRQALRRARCRPGAPAQQSAGPRTHDTRLCG